MPSFTTRDSVDLKVNLLYTYVQLISFLTILIFVLISMAGDVLKPFQIEC